MMRRSVCFVQCLSESVNYTHGKILKNDVKGEATLNI